MPILFEQPGPFAPEISAGYGRAQQYAQDAPLLQRQVENLTNLYAQEAGRRQQRQLAEQSMQFEGEQRSAANSAAAVRQDSENANRLELGQLESNTRLAEAQIDSNTRFGLQNDALLAQQARQQDNAMLADWLGNREMTRADAMRLQRQNNAISEVMNDEGLTRQEKLDYARELKTGIDVGQKRMQQTQQKALAQKTEYEAEKMKIQASHELAVRALAAKSLPERTSVIAAPGVMEQLGRSFDLAFPEVAAAAQIGGPQGMAAQAIRQQAIAEEAARSGGSTQYIEETPGKFSAVKHPKDDADIRLKHEEAEMKRFDLAQRRYDDHLKDAVARVDNINAAKKAKDVSREDVMANAKQDLEAMGIKPPELPKPAAKRQPFDFMGRQQGAGANLAPRSEPPQNVREANDRVLQEATERAIVQIQSRPDLPPQVKQQVAFAINSAREMLRRVDGDVSKLSTEDRKVYEQLKQMYRSLPPMPPPEPSPSRDAGAAMFGAAFGRSGGMRPVSPLTK